LVPFTLVIRSERLKQLSFYIAVLGTALRDIKPFLFSPLILHIII
jgi:hypothetical protein